MIHFSLKAGFLTSLIHGKKEATRVKTVGFLGVLHPRPSTKLVTPSTYHLLSGPLQFRGPPESPCKFQTDCYSSSRWSILHKPNTAFSGCFSHGKPTCSLLLRKPLLFLLSYPTNHPGCRHRDPPQEAVPAVA